LLETINPNRYLPTYFVKRLSDLFFGLILLMITLPFWLIVMVLIKSTSSGPIFYLSKRQGKNGKIITLYKFRTMEVNARFNGPA
jgi:lipopolysaccharide/colanic/teichoic acid biosynthesis glycosyltransferase